MNYLDFTRTTAVYPDSSWKPYLISGLLAEFLELQKERDQENIVKELGDICWFCARLSQHYGLPFKAAEYRLPYDDLVEVLSNLPKIFRGDYCSTKENLLMEVVIAQLLAYVEYLSPKDFLYILEQNMKKLKRRKERGTLKGEGNDR